MGRHTLKAKKRRGRTLKKTNFDNDGVYLEKVYTPEDFGNILQQCDEIHTLVDDPKAPGRLMHILQQDNPLINLIFNATLLRTVRRITGNDNLHPCTYIPVEYRKYGPGSFMNWHRDQQMLPNQNQYECVITLRNTSDSKTLLEYKKGIKYLETRPNSLLIVRANGINHAVTPTTEGSRTILKVVFSDPTLPSSPLF
jgi:hypothetical protein